MTEIEIERVLTKARKLAEKHLHSEAIKIIIELSIRFPENQQIIEFLQQKIREGGSSKEIDCEKQFSNALKKLYQTSQKSEIIKYSLTYLKVLPNSSKILYILGVAYSQSGQIEEAKTTFEKVLKLYPNHIEAHNNLCIIYRNLGLLDLALRTIKFATKLDPRNAQSFYNEGLVLFSLGSFGKSIESFKKAAAFKPNYAEAYNNCAVAYSELGETNLAIEHYKKAIEINPAYAEAHNNLGSSYIEINQFSDARKKFEKAITINGTFANAFFNLGNLHHKMNAINDAISAYKRAIEIDNNFISAYNNLGLCLNEIGLLQEAIDTFHRAIFINPNSAESYNNLGLSLNELGDFSEAKKAFKKALKIDKCFANAYRNLSPLVKFQKTDPEVTQIASCLKNGNINNFEKCILQYTFGKINEDLEKFQDAFKNYVTAGKLRRVNSDYTIDVDRKLFERIKEEQSKRSELNISLKIDYFKTIPIFILGMPRSGTTLVEQILAAHPEVYAAGEIDYFSELVMPIINGKRPISLKSLEHVRDEYLSKIRKLSDKKSYITDKMPHNFLYIDLIRQILPEAKIIHVKRDPAATCWSNFKQFFSGEGLWYSYDLNDTVEYYTMYRQLMNRWKKWHSDNIYDFDYDILVLEQERLTRLLLQHLGLNWNQKCLYPHKNKSVVKTASLYQVRQGIYQNSSKNWLKFADEINNVFEPLKSLN
jgi:tetratricopeptide (TPR) repeat protein